MPTEFDTPIVVVKTHTATADIIFKLTSTDSPLWMEDVNIHCYTNDARYGDLSTSATVGGILYAGDVVSFRNIDLNDIYFANDTAGSNCVITAVGVRMTKARMRELGIPVMP